MLPASDEPNGPGLKAEHSGRWGRWSPGKTVEDRGRGSRCPENWLFRFQVRNANNCRVGRAQRASPILLRYAFGGARCALPTLLRCRSGYRAHPQVACGVSAT